MIAEQLPGAGARAGAGHGCSERESGSAGPERESGSAGPERESGSAGPERESGTAKGGHCPLGVRFGHR
jgi:hypothetical protein